MSKAKKTFTKLCLNNWGGINHQVLHFHEYVNLFSGKSGSGKSTVMDAIQVILYGSFSSNFLNKAADDAKNKRSVLSYLRGEQKDGSANREGKDFCSTIVLEIEDKGTHIVNCVGLVCEVKKTDTELRRFLYFSHSGRMPESGYINENGVPFTVKEIKELIKERELSPDNKGKADVNRIYTTKESYLNVLNDAIMGYVDGTRFATMEKSAIALRMTNGTGQFIRDYMFPKSTGDTIQQISEQLGAYQEIKSQIEVLKKRIDELEEIKAYGQSIQACEIEQMKSQKILQCMDVEQTKQRMQEKKEALQVMEDSVIVLEKEGNKLAEKRRQIEDQLIAVSADLKSSDLGTKLQSLEELEKRGEMLSNDYAQWKHIADALRKWEQDEVITDYVSNPMLVRVVEFCKGQITEQDCNILRNNISETRKNLEIEYEEYNEQRRKSAKVLEEREKLVEDISNDRKPYSDQVKKAKSILSQKLSAIYGRTIQVHVFADLFDVKDEAWKEAIEGRLAKIKTSLIIEPQYAHDAAKVFRNMKEVGNVEFIHSKAVMESQLRALPNSLYEAVFTEIDYVDACLKRYLGKVIKCESITDLEKVRDGVTKDCYAYSSFIFRHLRKNDYTIYACIGTKVSKAKLKEYQTVVEDLRKEYAECCKMVEAFKVARTFESLGHEPKYLVQLSKASIELEKVIIQRDVLNLEIEELREGAFKVLEAREKELQESRRVIEQEVNGNHVKLVGVINKKNAIVTDITVYTRDLEKYEMGYVPDEVLEEWVRTEALKHYGSIKGKQIDTITRLQGQIQAEKDRLSKARIQYITNNPNCGFSGAEISNERYVARLAEYQEDYQEKYLQEFERQANLIHKSLRENVLSTIHGNIKAAKRHTQSINRLLRDTNFSDSTYQIKIEAAKDENGQFYEMLMAPELDVKNVENYGFEGQISFGEDEFYKKYDQKINLLLEKFMPLSKGDTMIIEQRQKEMEKYSDYRNYLSFSMYEQVTDNNGEVIRENYVDDMAGKDSGGEGQNPKYVALLAGFAMLYMQQSNRDSRIKLVLLDEAFSKMDQERSAVCLKYARKMELQLIVCVPDERLQSLIRNVDCVYGFRRHQNQIQMMHINKGDYLTQLEGNQEAETFV